MGAHLLAGASDANELHVEGGAQMLYTVLIVVLVVLAIAFLAKRL